VSDTFHPRGTLPGMESGVSFTDLDLATAERFVGLRRDLGVTTFGLNQMVLRPGERGRIHMHRHQEEVFLVLEGRLTLMVEGAVAEDLPVGRLVRIAPDVRRQLVNLGPERLVLLAIGGATPHEGRDGVAWRDWDDPESGEPRDIPLPDDLPAAELRTT
jgi:mannose-6-phosphate isomerase-like protein (cupin superfamily)